MFQRKRTAKIDNERLEKLAMPKYRYHRESSPVRKVHQFDLKPSDRLIALATPRRKRRIYDPNNQSGDSFERVEQFLNNENVFSTNKLYANVKATALKDLIRPRYQKPKYVKACYLSAKLPTKSKHTVSKRLILLSQPRDNLYQSPYKKDPFTVSKKALKSLSVKKQEKLSKLAKPQK